MALVKCGACGKEVSSEANTCPGCGEPMNAARIYNAGQYGIGCVAVAVIVGIGLLLLVVFWNALIVYGG